MLDGKVVSKDIFLCAGKLDHALTTIKMHFSF